MKIKLQNKKNINLIKNLLLEKYKDAKTELKYNNLYELLVCVMLSAQCTDKRVNIITPALFSEYPDIKSLSNAKLTTVKMLISSCSFFNNKATNLIKMANSVMNDFSGEIPLNAKDLVKLAGVGAKTANVVLIEYSNANLMAVDTHVFRTSHRLGLSDELTAIKTSEQLSLILKDNLNILHQALVLFGRYTCKAVKPSCQECFLSEFCKSKEVFKPS